MQWCGLFKLGRSIEALLWGIQASVISIFRFCDFNVFRRQRHFRHWLCRQPKSESRTCSHGGHGMLPRSEYGFGHLAMYLETWRCEAMGLGRCSHCAGLGRCHRASMSFHRPGLTSDPRFLLLDSPSPSCGPYEWVSAGTINSFFPETSCLLENPNTHSRCSMSVSCGLCSSQTSLTCR